MFIRQTIKSKLIPMNSFSFNQITTINLHNVWMGTAAFCSTWLKVINASISLEQIHPKWTLLFQQNCLHIESNYAESCTTIWIFLQETADSLSQWISLNETVQHSPIAAIERWSCITTADDSYWKVPWYLWNKHETTWFSFFFGKRILIFEQL